MACLKGIETNPRVTQFLVENCLSDFFDEKCLSDFFDEKCLCQLFVEKWVPFIRKICILLVNSVNPNPRHSHHCQQNDLVRDSEIKKVKPADH